MSAGDAFATGMPPWLLGTLQSLLSIRAAVASRKSGTAWPEYPTRSPRWPVPGPAGRAGPACSPGGRAGGAKPGSIVAGLEVARLEIGRSVDVRDEPWLCRLPAQQRPRSRARSRRIHFREPREPAEMLGCLCG